ncbi:MAG: hypothetical protein US50_C0037G0003 [Candidatus Nomurabacteria bacterium GW2011_GWB1_37_5]|uniref:Uncharacterized protein n=1 Tax=Candidatus Nomurabacteria bacterium GW2011_GWB1_37_5 TaxID=1618742 RepID=A0A0G0JDB2_9BACT|nr:MAG: hypothetical protein US50_C0037G0003 [Candidatus Nomurabacteria bacterium GW2011_GWB1_37_5]
MFNLFPDLLDYNFIVPVLFRIFLAYFLIKNSIVFFKSFISSHNYFVFFSSIIFLLSGAFTLSGFLIQHISIFFMVVLIFEPLFKRKQNYPFATLTPDFKFLLFITFLSMLFMGAGIFSFDLPL